MNRRVFTYVPGVVLAGLAAVLYSRAGYGPFGDAQQRSKPCEVSHCAHNASILMTIAVGLLLTAYRGSR